MTTSYFRLLHLKVAVTMIHFLSLMNIVSIKSSVRHDGRTIFSINFNINSIIHSVEETNLQIFAQIGRTIVQ